MAITLEHSVTSKLVNRVEQRARAYKPWRVRLPSPRLIAREMLNYERERCRDGLAPDRLDIVQQAFWQLCTPIER